MVHILISGFLSQESDKVEEWAEMVATMKGSEAYAISWESNTSANFQSFLMESVKNVMGGTKISEEYRKISKDNPFNEALDNARITGRIFAELVVRLFPNQFISLCGFSLGSLIIQEFLYRMIHLNQ